MLTDVTFVLKNGGHFLAISQKPILQAMTQSRINIDIYVMNFHGENLKYLEEMIGENGSKKPVVPIKNYKLKDFQSAFDYLKSRRVVGKLIFNP